MQFVIDAVSPWAMRCPRHAPGPVSGPREAARAWTLWTAPSCSSTSAMSISPGGAPLTLGKGPGAPWGGSGEPLQVNSGVNTPEMFHAEVLLPRAHAPPVSGQRLSKETECDPHGPPRHCGEPCDFQ